MHASGSFHACIHVVCVLSVLFEDDLILFRVKSRAGLTLRCVCARAYVLLTFDTYNSETENNSQVMFLTSGANLSQSHSFRLNQIRK